ncbi:pyridoxamine 5'-phosphate oxidase family protein [Roseicitreum antarcticum]|uniref:Pyridoxamine 5'-phosphate oxidase n=1 Tax=Roseicitreum antarcticum TaxID=564137 RepID=A0A1H3CCV8_9RHOB|nr:pyridoxamine 5'-phosphate oxidase family protein [Roseicitreum antarcticum]SDX51981.1 Pyridoxamine 5'-phosphate oxidase [Roseicitreum antarcticum]
MAKQFDSLTDDHRSIIAAQQMFFTGTAAREGRVNISPKGMDCLRVLSDNRVIWLSVTGSGNETAGHLADSPRMTLMFVSFDTRPMILRLYGTARAVYPHDSAWADLIGHFPPLPGTRQIYDMQVEMVQTSCGYAVPFYEHTGPRDTLKTWAEGKGDAGVHAYWAEKNQHTINGLPTGILSANADTQDA